MNATGATTVVGAFDPINGIADICEKYNLWLHVDVSIRINIIIVDYGIEVIFQERVDGRRVKERETESRE